MDTHASPYADVMTELPPVFPRLASPAVDLRRRPGGPGAAHAPSAAHVGATVDAVVAGGGTATPTLVYEHTDVHIPVPAAPLPAVPAPPAPAFAHDLLATEEQLAALDASISTAHEAGLDLERELDLGALSTAALAREALRARIIAVAAQREHRSAYELVFLMLAFAVMVLLVTPPIVQVLLAARGVQS